MYLVLHRFTTRRLIPLMAVATVGFVVVACGDDDDDGDGGGGATIVVTEGSATAEAAGGDGTASPEDSEDSDAGAAATSESEDDGTGSGGAEQTGLDPCGLITQAEAGQILGEPAGEPEVSDDGSFAACIYFGAAESSVTSLQAGVFTEDLEVDEEFFAQVANAAQTELEEIDGIGDQAAWDGVQVLFRKDGQLFSAIAESRDKSIELARFMADSVE